ncbi:beta-phosphoglucomutase [soil metagenome]
MSLPRRGAFIFDLDGVITDTAHLHFVAWRYLARSIDAPFDLAFNEQLKGVGRMESLELILARAQRSDYTHAQKLALAERKNADYMRLIDTITPADLLPGAVTSLIAARAAGCLVGLASASKNAAAVLKRLGITELFDHVVDANHIARSKPDPEVFLSAASALGVAPADCVGVEDAAAGVAAIRSAGMFALGVGDAHALAAADQVIPDLTTFAPSNYRRAGRRLQWVVQP